MATRDSSPSSRDSSIPPPQMDMCALLRWMISRDDAARAEREEEAARRRTEKTAACAEREEERREDAARLDAFLSRLASPGSLSPSPPPARAMSDSSTLEVVKHRSRPVGIQSRCSNPSLRLP